MEYIYYFYIVFNDVALNNILLTHTTFKLNGPENHLSVATVAHTVYTVDQE